MQYITFKKSIIVKITTKGEPIRSQFQSLYRIVRKSLLFLMVIYWCFYTLNILLSKKEILHILKVHFLDKKRKYMLIRLIYRRFDKGYQLNCKIRK